MIPELNILSRWLFCFALVVGTISCGGGGSGGGNPTTPDNPALDNPSNPKTSQLDAATFMIGYTYEEQGQEMTQLLGTAFAIDDHLLATNSHVTQGVLDIARQLAQRGIQVKSVSAFQSETGLEVPLLEALVHPSYTGSTRSPDVGLFVTRDILPKTLRLASAREAVSLKKGNDLQLNGFPGDVSQAIFGRSFTPGLSVPQATLFTGNIQVLQNFDERVVVDADNIHTIDMLQHDMDTTGGTSGSPILNRDKVVAVHNSGLAEFVVVREGGEFIVKRLAPATASWGVHVKHLHNLISEFNTGVLEADKRFRLPPSAALLATGGGQSSGLGDLAGTKFSGNVSNAENSNVQHEISITLDGDLNITGSSSWPANSALGRDARQFSLRGSTDANGRIEIVDDTPEVIPGFRRGIYTGNLNPASGKASGQYFEINDANELFYFGDWVIQSQ